MTWGSTLITMARPLKEIDESVTRNPTAAVALGLVVRRRRLELERSQEDLATEGMEQSFLSKIERGETEVSISSFLILAERLDMEPDVLMSTLINVMKHGAQ